MGSSLGSQKVGLLRAIHTDHSSLASDVKEGRLGVWESLKDSIRKVYVLLLN